MSAIKKLITGAAGAAGVGAEPLNVEDVFSTDIYDGNNSSITVTNNIDLSGEGGLIWVKSRTSADGHALMDTERGGSSRLNTSNRNAPDTAGATTFNSDGYTISTSNNNQNASGKNYVGWTFRKAPKFFDCIKYTGDGVTGRTISHNLDCDVGMIIVKNLSRATDWHVWHRGLTNYTYGIVLNDNQYGQFTNAGILTAAPTSSSVSIKNAGYDGNSVNANGDEYVMYLFAHNDGNGGFGENADQDIIKCGSYSNSGDIDLGFEPEFLLRVVTNTSGNWAMFDTMRGFGPHQGDSNEFYYLLPNSDGAEAGSYGQFPTSSGFYNDAGGDFIYVAIRRAPMAVATDATKVFQIDLSANTIPMMTAGFPPDISMLYLSNGNNDKFFTTRLLGDGFIRGGKTDAFTYQSQFSSEFSGSFSWSPNLANYYAAMWLRSPSFCDVVRYVGTGSTHTIDHNLGAIPEMMWVKKLNNVADWKVYHKDLGDLYGSGQPAHNYNLTLNDTSSTDYSTTRWGNDPTSTVFSVATHATTNASGDTYVCYLFSTLDGVSKVGSYTGNGTSQDIDCGFSSGARFVLIKRVDNTGSWQFWDTERGINAGAEDALILNDAFGPTSADRIDPYSSGFSVTSDANVNASNASFIFYAIA